MSSKQRKLRRRLIHPIVRQIIDRDCQVSMRNREVIRHVVLKLRDGHATFRAMPRRDRRELMLQCIEIHRANWELYVDVMCGDFSSRRRSRQRKGKKSS